MKKVAFFVIGLVIALGLYAQEKKTVSFSITGNKNLKLAMDGKVQALTNSQVANDNTKIVFLNIQTGQHSFQVDRTDPYTAKPEKISSFFNFRTGFDLLVKVNFDGSLELIETKRAVVVAPTPMSNYNFTVLLNNVKRQKTSTARKNLLTDAFNKPTNHFTSAQVIQLLKQVNSESYRLELAKLSYRSVTDRSNFYPVYDLLNNQENRDELETYVYDYDNSETGPGMPEADFNTLYETIRQQWPTSKQMTSLTEAFNNTEHLFTSYQASRLIQLVNAEANRLQLAKLSYRSITDRENFYMVIDLIGSQVGKNELQTYINNYDTGSGTGVAMADSEFNTLYTTIEQQWPVSRQMSSLTDAFNDPKHYFTTYQASRLIQIVNAESNRLQLAKLAYRTITDRSNFNQVYYLLNSQASRDELEAYIKNFDGGATTVKVPMADADFNSLYQSVQAKYMPFEKMNTLTGIFNNTSYFFSSAQAKQLIALVSLESNRLYLAKLSYRTITDRANFSQVYDLLTSPASRQELEEYVRTYKD